MLLKSTGGSTTCTGGHAARRRRPLGRLGRRPLQLVDGLLDLAERALLADCSITRNACRRFRVAVGNCRNRARRLVAQHVRERAEPADQPDHDQAEAIQRGINRDRTRTIGASASASTTRATTTGTKNPCGEAQRRDR